MKIFLSQNLSIMKHSSPYYLLPFRGVYGFGHCSGVCTSRCNSHHRNSLFVSVSVSNNTSNIFTKLIYEWCNSITFIHVCVPVCICQSVCLLVSLYI